MFVWSLFFSSFIFITSNVSEYNVHYYYRKKKHKVKPAFHHKAILVMRRMSVLHIELSSWLHSEKCMDLYHKPTDTQRCLPYSTSHTKHCLKNVPFVMVRSMCTIVENNSVKNKYLKELKENFRTYGYL